MNLPKAGQHRLAFSSAAASKPARSKLVGRLLVDDLFQRPLRREDRIPQLRVVERLQGRLPSAPARPVSTCSLGRLLRLRES